jgi:predicted DsbA family dithiol-disulfide isomerase
MHDLLMKEHYTDGIAALGAAEALGMDRTDFARCLDEEEHPQRIDREIQLAESLGLTGTPGFALGRIAEDDVVVVEKLISGAYPLGIFEAAIEEMR